MNDLIKNIKYVRKIRVIVSLRQTKKTLNNSLTTHVCNIVIIIVKLLQSL